MRNLLLLATREGREVAVFTDQIGLISETPSCKGAVIGLMGEEEIFTKASYEDVLHTLCSCADVMTWRIRPAPITSLSAGTQLERLEIARQFRATEPETN